MIARGYALSLLLVLLALAGCAMQPVPFKFYEGSLNPEQVSYVKVQRGFGDPLLIFERFDGNDPSRYPAMKDVRRDTFDFDPQVISVEPGEHSFGVLFVFIDIPGKLVTAELTEKLAEKYLENPGATNVRYATVKHFEELRFNVEPNRLYYIQYQFDGHELRYFVDECGKDGERCARATFDSSNQATKVVYSERNPTPAQAAHY